MRRADVRIVGATHVDLRRAVAEKNFRADLFYRLHEIEIQLPALRDRPRGRPAAGAALPARLRRARADRSSTRARRTCCVAYAWPGNVRELENCMKRALALATVDGRAADRAALTRSAARRARWPTLDLPGPQLRAQLAEADRREILAVLDEAQGNKSRAAERLGISRKTLYARLRRLGLEVE